MSESFKVVNYERESKQSFQEFLQMHLNEPQDSQLRSPTQENNYNSTKQIGIRKTIKREESEPSFRITEQPIENNEKNLTSMQSKIQLLITENSKLIEINSGLMREIEIMKQNNSSNRTLLVQESQQKLMNYQQKVVQLTQANEQLSSRLIDEQTKNKKEIEQRFQQILLENKNLNEMLQTRLNDIDILNNQLLEKNDQIALMNEEIKVVNEKCMVLEQQKQVLIAQQQQYVDTIKEFQAKEQQFMQQLYQEQTSYQSCIANLEQNYNLQISELRNSFLKEIEQQQETIAQQYQNYFNQQIITFQQQIKALQLENTQIKDELTERSKIWSQEKERLENFIKNIQQSQLKKQNSQESIQPLANITQAQQNINQNQKLSQQINQPNQNLDQQQIIQPQNQQQLNQIQNQQQFTQEQLIQQKQELQKQQYYQEILQIQSQSSLLQQQQQQQKILQQQQNQNHHQSSNYTFRQNTQEDSREVSPEKDDLFQNFDQKARLHTESYGYEKTIPQRAPLQVKNYRVPQLHTITRYDQKQYNFGVNQPQYYQNSQQRFMINRDPQYQRSHSQYQERDDKPKSQQYQNQNEGYLVPKRY
ncbi:unnamed protein product (macronuclear) [Paramecium tetraurelia]|uniref:Uncharacterized protein n=1 Tax=Paramecium tetraurelia TaxID=5888 RepID=A0CUM8_PARTE|nr:uncharacterized protein GSPATT00010695001 [Paramecium tetraurelia]CAK74495.1 unnamed protein product [Paramecium tetraurelia]|eukprot:XP_001441892.1 hypothetical protein (macronuclear) [Paramecium tetraurelia strain d4-2]